MGFKAKIIDSGIAEIRKQIQADLSPFGRTTKAQKAERKKAALADFQFFARTYFPHYCTSAPSLMHREFFEKFQAMILEAQKTGVGAKDAEAAPRGNAKSTISGLFLPLWCIAGKHRRFVAMISDSTDQANEFLEFVKAELEVNERLAEDFPEICGMGSKWAVGHITTKNGVKVRCWGRGKRLRGARAGSRRPDLVIVDDLEDDEGVNSPDQRRKLDSWFFKALMKAGAKYTVFIVVGTILHYDSLLARLLKQPGWTGKKYKAVIAWSPSPRWEEWEGIFSNPANDDAEKDADQFFAANENEMLAGTKVLWPEVEDYYFLMKMRVSDGPAFFDSEKQNEPINPDDCLFQESWIVYVEEEEVIRNLEYGEYTGFFCSVDPSMGKQKKTSDPSAIVIGGVLPNGMIDVLEADIAKRHPDAIMETLFNYNEIYRFSSLAIEEVQFQELFKDQLIKESARRGAYLPVTGTRPHVDKTMRIMKLQPQIKNSVIRFRRNQTTLIEQLKYFPKADHDDGPDALEMLFSLIAHGSNGPRIRRVA
jgi:predicted phage terminase large subunit-like protein